MSFSPVIASSNTCGSSVGLPHAGWWEAYREGDAAPDGVHRTQAASDRLVGLLIAAIDLADVFTPAGKAIHAG